MKKFRKGFTLIEVALAVLVVAIGILAVVALFSSGLSSSTKAIADTHASMFAENVMKGLRARSLVWAETQAMLGDNVLWTNFWVRFARGATSVTIMAASPTRGVWKTNVTAAFPITANTLYTQVFENLPQHGGGVAGITNQVFRYKIGASLRSASASNTVSTRISTNCTWVSVRVTNYTATASLYVWDGQFGRTDTNDALIFYSEFGNQGDL